MHSLWYVDSTECNEKKERITERVILVFLLYKKKTDRLSGICTEPSMHLPVHQRAKRKEKTMKKSLLYKQYISFILRFDLSESRDANEMIRWSEVGMGRDLSRRTSVWELAESLRWELRCVKRRRRCRRQYQTKVCLNLIISNQPTTIKLSSYLKHCDCYLLAKEEKGRKNMEERKCGRTVSRGETRMIVRLQRESLCFGSAKPSSGIGGTWWGIGFSRENGEAWNRRQSQSRSLVMVNGDRDWLWVSLLGHSRVTLTVVGIWLEKPHDVLFIFILFFMSLHFFQGYLQSFLILR